MRKKGRPERRQGGGILKIRWEERGDPFRVLCIGAHCDDLEIGCGGTVLRLANSLPNLDVRWVVFSGNAPRKKEAMTSAKRFLEMARTKRILLQEFRDGFFPYNGGRIKEVFEGLKRDNAPDMIFTHYRNDLHQDHRLLSELTWNTFRDHLILEYEIPKYDGDLGTPNFFVHLDDAICRKKIDILTQCYGSQQDRRWFTEDTFRSILRLRGIESNSPSNYAEGFYCRKIVL